MAASNITGDKKAIKRLNSKWRNLRKSLLSQLISLTTVMKATAIVAAVKTNVNLSTLTRSSARQPRILRTWSKSSSNKTNNRQKWKSTGSEIKLKVTQVQFTNPQQLDSVQTWTKILVLRINSLLRQKTISQHLLEILIAACVSQAWTKHQLKKLKTRLK